MTKPTEKDLENLRHMLGASNPKKKREWGYRNYFVAGGPQQIEEMESLVSKGFATKGGNLNKHNPASMMTLYHATEAGCRTIGFTDKQIKRLKE